MNFITVNEAAKKLGITRQGVQYLIQTKQLEAVWILNRWGIPADEITRLRRLRSKRASTAA